MSMWFTPLPAARLDRRQLRLIEQLRTGDARRDGVRLSDSGDEGLPGPFEILLRSPRLGSDLARMGGRFEVQSALTPKVRELLICLVAAKRASTFEWEAHVPLATSVGVASHQLTAIREDGPILGLSGEEDAHVQLATALLDHMELDESRRSVLLEVLGEERAAEVAILVGYYELLAHVLKVGGR
jgi:4-carboxymuconolactone decarboxylase